MDKEELLNTLRDLRRTGWKRQDIKDIVDDVCNEIPLGRHKNE